MSDSEDDKKAMFPFHEMGIDDRILKAIAKLGWIEPTLIQVCSYRNYIFTCTWRYLPTVPYRHVQIFVMKFILLNLP